MEGQNESSDARGLMGWLLGAATSPRATWGQYAERNASFVHTYARLSLPLALGTAVVTALLGTLLGTLPLGGFGGMLRQMIFVAVMGAVALPIYGAVFGGLAGRFGGRTNVAAGLAAVTLAFVPGVAGQILGTLPWIGWLLSLILGIYSLVLLYKAIPVFLQVEGGKRPLHFIVALIACLLLGMLISKPLTSIVGPSAHVASERIRGVDTAGDVAGALFGEDAKDDMQMLTRAHMHKYMPPVDGRVSQAQVNWIIEVGEQALVLRDERAKKLKEARDSGELSASTITTAMATRPSMQVVMQTDGNWAEYQWIVQRLIEAKRSAGDGAGRAHNRTLYAQHAEALDRALAVF